MSTYLPKDVLSGLNARRAEKNANHAYAWNLTVTCIQLCACGTMGLLDAENAPHLRGFVDIYEGQTTYHNV